MTRTRLLAGTLALTRTLALTLAIPGVTAADPWKDESGHDRGDADYTERWNNCRLGGRDEIWRPGDRIPPLYPPRHAEHSIPPGHLPPPGQCRI